MKKFYYMVEGWERMDTVAFGEVWKEAKAKAKELNTYIARRVVQDGKEDRYEVYLKGGAFLNAEYATKDRYYIW